MAVPKPNLTPPFNVTRAGHAVMRVKDLAASKRFYTEVIGLLVSDETADTVWLRGVEESAHHSLVLKRTTGDPLAERIGLRVGSDADLEKAKAYFDGRGIAARFVEVAHQGPTLHVSDAAGVPLELVARMPSQPRHHHHPHLHKGAAALRLDHFQILAPDVESAGRFYGDIGFRISSYFVQQAARDKPLGLFMYRKQNPHDMVFLTRPGPVLHHYAYIVAEPSHIFRALDWSASIGMTGLIERGPGRHGQGHQLYAYLRDPDGHRVEILPPPIQMGDADDAPEMHDRPGSGSWELPPPKSWIHEGSRFVDVPVTGTLGETGFFSLEDYLDEKARRRQVPG